MIAADEILSRARDYRKNIAPEGVHNNPLSYDEEVQHLQIKLRIIDRLAKDAGKSLDDHQLFTVAVSHAMQAVADRLSGDSLLKAAFTDLATNVELVCRSPISDVQLNQLSRAIYDAGGLYYQKKYFVHAIACYSQAQRGFRKTGAFDEERESEYRLRLSTWRAQRSVLRLITGFWSGLLFGFGFRPYRVLWAIVVVILLFGLAYRKLIVTEGTARKVVYCGARADPSLEKRLESKATVVRVGDQDVRAGSVVADLATRGISQLMIEGGARTIQLFLQEGLVDAIRLAVAPVVCGARGRARPFVGSFPQLANRERNVLRKVEALGDTAVIWYELERADGAAG